MFLMCVLACMLSNLICWVWISRKSKERAAARKAAHEAQLHAIMNHIDSLFKKK